LKAPTVVRRAFASSCRGQSIVEFAIVLPFLMLVVLGVTEVGYALLDSHIVTKLTRESSNLISRDTTIDDAVTAIRSMSTRPVNFNDGSSKIIFSVIKNVATNGVANHDKAILYQRYTFGSYPGTSALSTAGTGSYGSGPNYVANSSDTDTRLQVTNLPGGMTLTLGGMMYVTEIYTRHTLITPLNNFGVSVPQTLYSIAYF
jgi:Flp pilus assembly protein TadG